MHRNPARPLSPHLTIWRWGAAMAVSILHRVTGAGLATVGALALVWWLVAAASGGEAYARFAGWASWKWALLFWVPLTWAFWQHTLSGLRHFVMDVGAGFELRTNRLWAWLVMVFAVLFTALTWAAIFFWKLV